MKQFQKVPIAVNQRTRQNLSSSFIGSHDFGRLDVVYHNADIVPGDDINLSIDGFLRAAPMPAPTFGNVDIDIRVFFVPHRIATSRPTESGVFSWDNYITGVSSASHPYGRYSQIANSFAPLGSGSPLLDSSLHKDCRRLLSQLKFPQYLFNATSAQFNVDIKDNLWLLHAYQRIWWDYYRDSSLIDESLIRNYCPLLVAGNQPTSAITTLCTPRYACFQKDYFTTAKLNPQSGVSSAAVPTMYNESWPNYVTLNPNNAADNYDNIADPGIFSQGPVPIQWLRAANALQTYLERNNLSGSRLMERFLARFGVSPSSVALDMSEYLGGSRTTLRIGDITANNESFGNDFDPANAFNTASVDGSASGTILGQLGGKAAADCKSDNISFHAKEFGTLMAIQTIVPHVSYTQGLPKEHTRGIIDRFQYFTPEMENIGYEPVYTSELYEDANMLATETVLGYVPRYQSYKTRQDVVSGDLVLSETSAGMDSWHLARLFDSQPSLTYDFTMITPTARHSLDRVFSIIGETGQLDHFNSWIHSECHIVRDMSDNALPTLEESRSGKAIEIQNGGVRF